MPHHQEIMGAALEAEYGLGLQSASRQEASKLRRQFYAARERLRTQGEKSYDILSFIITKDRELWIIPRTAIKPNQSSLEGIPIRPLNKHEMPDAILSRGRHRFAFLRIP